MSTLGHRLALAQLRDIAEQLATLTAQLEQVEHVLNGEVIDLRTTVSSDGRANGRSRASVDARSE